VNQGTIPDKEGFKPMAAVVWAIVMYLFTIDPKSLQGSLRSSMEFLYNDENYGSIPGRSGTGFVILDKLLPFLPFSG
jgi:hypothetical protein